jgi:hypothetical protein
VPGRKIFYLNGLPAKYCGSRGYGINFNKKAPALAGALFFVLLAVYQIRRGIFAMDIFMIL